MDNQNTSLAYDADKARGQINEILSGFHNEIDEIIDGFHEDITEALLNEAAMGRSITEETAFAQLIMERMFAHPLDLENTPDIAVLTSENKVRLVRMATHLGPDYAQALYHAAVFITKVA